MTRSNLLLPGPLGRPGFGRADLRHLGLHPPFHPAGPRLDTEHVGDTVVVHDYGRARDRRERDPAHGRHRRQAVSGDEMRGYGDDTTAPDRAEAEEAVATLAEFYARFGRAAS